MHVLFLNLVVFLAHMLGSSEDWGTWLQIFLFSSRRCATAAASGHFLAEKTFGQTASQPVWPKVDIREEGGGMCEPSDVSWQFNDWLVCRGYANELEESQDPSFQLSAQATCSVFLIEANMLNKLRDPIVFLPHVSHCNKRYCHFIFRPVDHYCNYKSFKPLLNISLVCFFFS